MIFQTFRLEITQYTVSIIMYIFELTYNQQSLVLYHRRKTLASKLSSSLINAIEEV